VKRLELSLNLYDKVGEFKQEAKRYAQDEQAFEAYLKESALILLQMDREQAITRPEDRLELAASIKARAGFIQKASDLLSLLVRSAELRLKEAEAAADAQEREIELLLARERTGAA